MEGHLQQCPQKQPVQSNIYIRLDILTALLLNIRVVPYLCSQNSYLPHDFSLCLKALHKTFQQDSLVIYVPYRTLCLWPLEWVPQPCPKSLCL